MCIKNVMNMLKHITRIAYKQKPEKGEKGERGAQTRQMVWAAGIEFFSGAPGEEYEDYAFCEGQVYQCLQHHISKENETPYDSVSGNTGKWRLVPGFDNFSTRVLLLGKGKEGWVMDQGVIKHTSGKISLTAAGQIVAGNNMFTVDKDGNMTAKSGTFGNLTIGQTAMGYPCLKGSVFYDEDEEHFIELSPEAFIIGARVNGEEAEVIDLMPFYYSDKYDRNEAFRIKMRPFSHMTIESGMVAGLREQLVVSSDNTTSLGSPGGTGHPGKYVLTYTPDAFIHTLQTDEYVTGDCFTIINKNGDSVGVVNNTQYAMYNLMDGTRYVNGECCRIMATTTRVFHMLWTGSGFLIYK